MRLVVRICILRGFIKRERIIDPPATLLPRNRYRSSENSGYLLHFYEKSVTGTLKGLLGACGGHFYATSLSI